MLRILVVVGEGVVIGGIVTFEMYMVLIQMAMRGRMKVTRNMRMITVL
jgi:hypothetical protein